MERWITIIPKLAFDFYFPHSFSSFTVLLVSQAVRVLSPGHYVVNGSYTKSEGNMLEKKKRCGTVQMKLTWVGLFQLRPSHTYILITAIRGVDKTDLSLLGLALNGNKSVFFHCNISHSNSNYQHHANISFSHVPAYHPSF